MHWNWIVFWCVFAFTNSLYALITIGDTPDRNFYIRRKIKLIIDFIVALSALLIAAVCTLIDAIIL